MSNDKEIIIEQQEQIAEYQSLLSELLQKPKQIGIIIAGPFSDRDTIHYNVKIGSSSVLVTKPKKVLFGADLVIQEGDEVAVVEGAIIGVVPKELRKQEAKVNVKLTTWDQVGG